MQIWNEDFHEAIDRVCTGFGMFWKVIKINNAIFQDLESFEKARVLSIAMENLDFSLGKF